MERIFFVRNGDLQEVNMLLQKGATVKSIHPIAQNVSSYGYGGGGYPSGEGSFTADVCSYIVLEFM